MAEGRNLVHLRNYCAKRVFWSGENHRWLKSHPDTDHMIASAIFEVSEVTGRRRIDILRNPDREEFALVMHIALNLPVMIQSLKWAGIEYDSSEVERYESRDYEVEG
ncbi:MAG: hypothetical protein RH862_20430 [Leptospiraceae bacterium]